jgi:hypothetical protein
MLDELEAVGSLRDADAVDGALNLGPRRFGWFPRADRHFGRNQDADASEKNDFQVHHAILSGRIE